VTRTRSTFYRLLVMPKTLWLSWRFMRAFGKTFADAWDITKLATFRRK
jgi:hypothetical protein